MSKNEYPESMCLICGEMVKPIKILFDKDDVLIWFRYEHCGERWDATRLDKEMSKEIWYQDQKELFEREI